MGNHMSCMSPAAALHDCNKNLIKFLHFETGAISELEGPLTAAEVMLEFPAQFLCCFSSVVSSGRRICAVPADEELRATELYMLLPMHKLNTRFSSEDMGFFAALVSQLSTAGKQSSKGSVSPSKVAPLPASMSSTQSAISEGFRGQLSRGSVSFKLLDAQPVSISLEGSTSLCIRSASNHKMCRSKSWMPKLETITEATASISL